MKRSTSTEVAPGGGVRDRRLQNLTPARVALDRVGTAIGTADHLRFQLDHALARDAVQTRLDVPLLEASLQQRLWPILTLRSAASSKSDDADDRRVYLQRPDLGRRLHGEAAALLRQFAVEQGQSGQLVFVLADGLSARAIERHAMALLDGVHSRASELPWPFGPVCIVRDGRVAIGDEIGALLHADAVVVLIGERPGLSAPDSMGAYLTMNPAVGRTDAERNCISNIRAGGLSYESAVDQLLSYLTAAKQLGRTGVDLKANTPVLPAPR